MQGKIENRKIKTLSVESTKIDHVVVFATWTNLSEFSSLCQVKNADLSNINNSHEILIIFYLTSYTQVHIFRPNVTDLRAGKLATMNTHLLTERF